MFKKYLYVYMERERMKEGGRRRGRGKVRETYTDTPLSMETQSLMWGSILQP